MKIYVEDIENSGIYGLIDTDIKEDVTLIDRTIYQQDMTAIFKGFTSSMAINATPNNIKLLGFFGETNFITPPKKTRNAKIYINELLYKTGTITIENVSYKNGVPSLFQISFSDGAKNLTQLLGDDTLDMLANEDTTGNIYYNSSTVKSGLQGVVSSPAGVKWFVPLVSTNRIFSVDSETPDATDNIVYSPIKNISDENILLLDEVRPAMYVTDIIKRIENKYNFKLNFPYYDIPFKTNQLKDLAIHCLSGSPAANFVNAKITKTEWNREEFREVRFDIIIKKNIGGSGVDGFELQYLGPGNPIQGKAAKFGMYITLENADSKLINSIEIWEVDSDGNYLKQINYQLIDGAPTKSNYLRVNLGLDLFKPQGQSTPSTLIKPLIAVRVSADNESGWTHTKFNFDWEKPEWNKRINDNVQPAISAQTNLFSLLPKVKTIDFIKSIYTAFGLKNFTDKNGNINAINDFWYVPKIINGTIPHNVRKVVNESLSQYADLANVSKKPNIFYDAYNLKHKTSDYLSNKAFAENPSNNGLEYGQLKYPATGNPKSVFMIETEFTAPVFVSIAGNLSEDIRTYYPFTGEPHLNDSSTRFIYDTVTDEIPFFYRNGVVELSPLIAYRVHTNPILGWINKCHVINYINLNIKTVEDGINNYISLLYGLLTTDLSNQNTLYSQGYKAYIEGTLNENRLVHEINLNLPSNVVVESFSNSQDVIVGETKFQVLESNISLTTGKTKLTLLNY